MSTSIDGDLESTTTAGDDDVSARTGPTADGSAKDGTAAAPRATMRRLRTRRIGVGLVIAALVAAAAATTWKAHQVQQVEDARVGALEAARTRVPALLTYDSSRLDADLGKANEQTTGPFHDDYATVLEEVVSPTAKERGISTVPRCRRQESSARRTTGSWSWCSSPRPRRPRDRVQQCREAGSK